MPSSKVNIPSLNNIAPFDHQLLPDLSSIKIVWPSKHRNPTPDHLMDQTTFLSGVQMVSYTSYQFWNGPKVDSFIYKNFF
jgi:hypothetical protein